MTAVMAVGLILICIRAYHLGYHPQDHSAGLDVGQPLRLARHSLVQRPARVLQLVELLGQRSHRFVLTHVHTDKVNITGKHCRILNGIIVFGVVFAAEYLKGMQFSPWSKSILTGLVAALLVTISQKIFVKTK